MAVWTYSIDSKGFDVSEYAPLQVANYSEQFEVPFEVSFEYSFDSTLFGTHNTFELHMTGTFTQYVNNQVGGIPSYPCLILAMGNTGQCGALLRGENNVQVSNLSGYAIENGVRRELSTFSQNDTFNAVYTVNGQFTVHTCTIPIFFMDTPADLSDYMWTTNNPNGETYNMCPTGQVPWNPVSKPLTNDMCKNIVNYKEGEFTPDGQDFRLDVQWTTSTWTSDSQPTITGQPNVQGVKGRITEGKFGLYTISGISEGKLMYGIKSTAVFYELEYTTDGVNWTPTDTFPFEFIYRPRINELGTFSYALSTWNTDLPVWDSEQDAQDYLDGLKPISDAKNWDKISSQYPQVPTTGIADDEPTTMGDVYTRAFFSQQYICSVSAMQEISNALFDVTQGGITGLWEDIKKGLEMYGDSPVDDIQGCMFFPLNLNEVFTSTQSQNYIYFGGYKFDMQTSVNKIIYPNGYKDFGSFKLNPLYSDSKLNHWRDYAPYTRLFCYLPYIGWVELDIARYIGKTVSVRYYFDTRTGGCLACLFAGGTLYDYFNGQCGVAMPITATDYVAYLNSQMQVLLGGSSDAKGNMGTVYNAGMNMAQNGMLTAGSGMALGSVGAMGVAVAGTKTLYGLTQNNINNFNKTKGASTSMLNQYLPQEVMFLLETQDADISENELSLMGYPSNASGTLQTFSGYLEVDTINLVCADATDNEKAEIIRQLQQGVYI